MFKTRAAIATTALLLAACGQAPTEEAEYTPSQSELVAQGEAMAETMCASCHAIGLTDTGAHPDTVPFRQLSWKYDIEFLAEPLAEGIIVGHPDMPVFQFEPQDIDALLAYIESVQVPQPT